MFLFLQISPTIVFPKNFQTARNLLFKLYTSFEWEGSLDYSWEPDVDWAPHSLGSLGREMKGIHLLYWSGSHQSSIKEIIWVRDYVKVFFICTRRSQ